jgi:hypothetical protein
MLAVGRLFANTVTVPVALVLACNNWAVVMTEKDELSGITTTNDRDVIFMLDNVC